MSISYPLQMPDVGGFTSYSLYSENMVGRSSSPYTGGSQVQDYGTGVWKLDVSLAAMNQETASQWIAFLASLRGVKGTFLAGDPKKSASNGNMSGLPRFSSSNGAGTEINIIGMDASLNNALMAGDFIQIGTRLFLVLKNMHSDINGNGTVDIWPALKEEPSVGDVIITDNAKGLFHLVDDSEKLYSVTAKGAYMISFTAMEPGR